MRYFNGADDAKWRWEPATDTLWTWSRWKGEWVEQLRITKHSVEHGWTNFVNTCVARGRWEEVIQTHTPATTAEVW